MYEIDNRPIREDNLTIVLMLQKRKDFSRITRTIFDIISYSI